MSTRQRGFTLIELIVALVLSVIVVGLALDFISVPVQAHFAQTRRAELTASAEAVTHWMSQDVRAALPNSLRTGRGRRSSGRGNDRPGGVCDLSRRRCRGGPAHLPGTRQSVRHPRALPGAAATHVVVRQPRHGRTQTPIRWQTSLRRPPSISHRRRSSSTRRFTSPPRQSIVARTWFRQRRRSSAMNATWWRARCVATTACRSPLQSLSCRPERRRD